MSALEIHGNKMDGTLEIDICFLRFCPKVSKTASRGFYALKSVIEKTESGQSGKVAAVLPLCHALPNRKTKLFCRIQECWLQSVELSTGSRGIFLNSSRRDESTGGIQWTFP